MTASFFGVVLVVVEGGVSIRVKFKPLGWQVLKCRAHSITVDALLMEKVHGPHSSINRNMGEFGGQGWLLLAAWVLYNVPTYVMAIRVTFLCVCLITAAAFCSAIVTSGK